MVTLLFVDENAEEIEIEVSEHDDMETIAEALGITEEDAEGIDDACIYVNGKVVDAACSPDDALTIAEIVEDMTDTEKEAYVLYCNNLHEIASIDNFRDAYRGTYRSTEEYAEELFTDVYGLGDIPDVLRRNIDWEGVWDELENDGEFAETGSSGMVHVFTAV